MKPVSVKPVFNETGLEPVLKPVLDELKPVLKCLPKDEITENGKNPKIKIS